MGVVWGLVVASQLTGLLELCQLCFGGPKLFCTSCSKFLRLVGATFISSGLAGGHGAMLSIQRRMIASTPRNAARAPSACQVLAAQDFRSRRPP